MAALEPGSRAYVHDVGKPTMVESMQAVVANVVGFSGETYSLQVSPCAVWALEEKEEKESGNPKF